MGDGLNFATFVAHPDFHFFAVAYVELLNISFYTLHPVANNSISVSHPRQTM